MAEFVKMWQKTVNIGNIPNSFIKHGNIPNGMSDFGTVIRQPAEEFEEVK